MNVVEKNSYVPLNDVLLSPNANRDYLEVILGTEVPVLCVNREAQKKRSMPFKALYSNNKRFWLQRGNWQFFFTNKDFEKIRNKANVAPRIWEPKVIRVDQDLPPKRQTEGSQVSQAAGGLGLDYETLKAMSVTEQNQLLNNRKLLLSSLIKNKTQNVEAVTMALADTTRVTTMVNHAILLKAIHLGDKEAKIITQGLVNSTCEITKLSTYLISQGIFDNELLNTLLQKSNGTIIQHITRVFLNGVAFLFYYNKLVSTTSAINKIRISFPAKYRYYYHYLLPDIEIDDLTLERVFYKGMRAIPPDHLFHWALGFLLHDIGKSAAVEYHEGQSGYNRNLVIEHVKIGCDSVMHKTNYPKEAGLILGCHHEYYGDSSGYGYFRNYLEYFKKIKPNVKHNYCMAGELEALLDFETCAYFPAKILEIIDIYDSITDPNRVYRNVMSPEEALTAMRGEFIEQRHKIDIILFDIFCSFIRENHK